MEAKAGTYILILFSPSAKSVRVGRLGKLTLEKGYYLYVGSAFGPGGVAARVKRHRKKHKLKCWHIDYLRAVTSPVEVWYSHDSTRREHEWADFLQQGIGLSTPMLGFGASDCRCQTHLYFSPLKPAFVTFSQAMGQSLQNPILSLASLSM